MFDTMGMAIIVGVSFFLVLWPISLIKKDASIVDFWWGPGFAAMGFTAAAQSPLDMGQHQWLILGLVTVWALRLGVVLGLRRISEGIEDQRYTEMRQKNDPGFWWKSFFIVFLLQAVIQVILASGFLATFLEPPQAVGTMAILGSAIALTGFGVEARSDWELDQFRRTTPHGGLLTSGLRSVVRYPSYLGEMMFWSGITVIAVSAGVVWAPVCAILLILMLIKLSGVSLSNKRMQRTRPGYARYRETVPALLPRLGKAGMARRETQ